MLRMRGKRCLFCNFFVCVLRMLVASNIFIFCSVSYALWLSWVEMGRDCLLVSTDYRRFPDASSIRPIGSLMLKVAKIRSCFMGVLIQLRESWQHFVSTDFHFPSTEKNRALLCPSLVSLTKQDVTANVFVLLGSRLCLAPGFLCLPGSERCPPCYKEEERFPSTATAGLCPANLKFCSILCFKSKQRHLIQVSCI